MTWWELYQLKCNDMEGRVSSLRDDVAQLCREVFIVGKQELENPTIWSEEI